MTALPEASPAQGRGLGDRSLSSQERLTSGRDESGAGLTRSLSSAPLSPIDAIDAIDALYGERGHFVREKPLRWPPHQYQPRHRYYPAQPLRDTLRQLAIRKGYLGLRGFCLDRDIWRRPLYRNQLRDTTIDNICVAAGLHPVEVYPTWFILPPGLPMEVAS